MADKLEVLPGPGLVARFGDVAVWAGPQCSPALQAHLVSEAQKQAPTCRGPTGKLVYRGPTAWRPGASGTFCNRRAWGKRPGPVPARACPGLGQRSLAGAAAGARLDGNFDRPTLAPDNPALRSFASSPKPAREPLRPLVRRGPWFGLRSAATTAGTGAGERDGPSHRFVSYFSRRRPAGPGSGRAGALRRTARLWRPARWSWHRAGSCGSWAW